MEETKGLLLRVLLNRSSGQIPESTLKLLPAQLVNTLRLQTMDALDPIPLFKQEENILGLIHYSWLYAPLKDQPLEVREAILRCLNEKQRQGLAKLFKEAPPSPLPNGPWRNFLKKRFSLLPEGESPLPIEYIPESPLKSLILAPKSQLVELIDLLGMYDLAHELRGIVATKNLKNLYSCLTPKQQQFLKQCMHQKDKVIPAKLQLETWKGDYRELMQLLHRRGIARLGLALSHEHNDLAWYIIHVLDSGRGTLLKKAIRKEAPSQLSATVISQVESAWNYLIRGLTSE